MKIIVCLFLLLTFSSIAIAENLCSKVESKGEGHWPIPESTFNIENVVKARKGLNKALIEMEQNSTLLTLKNSIGLYGEVKNDLIMIEGYIPKQPEFRIFRLFGYILRAQAIDATDKGKGDDSVQAWCEFFESTAVVWH